MNLRIEYSFSTILQEKYQLSTCPLTQTFKVRPNKPVTQVKVFIHKALRGVCVGINDQGGATNIRAGERWAVKCLG